MEMNNPAEINVFIKMCQDAKEVSLKYDKISIRHDIYERKLKGNYAEECAGCRVEVDSENDNIKNIFFCDEHSFEVDVTHFVPKKEG